MRKSQASCPGLGVRAAGVAFSAMMSCWSPLARGQCAFEVQPLHQAEAPIFLLAVGEIDASHAGPEVLAVDADGVILQLTHGARSWNVAPLNVTVEPGQIMNVRPTINIGDVHPGFPGNEIVIETFNTVNVLVQSSPGQWQKQIVLDGDEFFGSVWGVRIGDIDPALPGDELFYIIESFFDFSAGWVASLVNGEWESRVVFNAEVGMDAAIGDTAPGTPGNEIVVGTEMGPVYEITSQPANTEDWPRTTLWNDFDNAPWTLRIADILPDLPGNEIAYGSRYSDRLLLSHASGAAHDMEVVFTGVATEAMTMWDIAVGNVILESTSLEIVGVDQAGMAYLARHDGSRWSGQTIWSDAGALHAAVVADVVPDLPGPEIIVAGQSGSIVLLSRAQPVPGDITCDGTVDVNDLLAVVSAWGPCPAPPALCPADIAPSGGDGQVNVNDLLLVITNWH